MSKNFYITTTLPYVNADLHVGHALEFIRADVIARYKKESGYTVFFNTGSDEHGAKVQKNAESLGIDTQKYVDEKSSKFKAVLPLLGLLPDIHFVRTTDVSHKEAAQAFWTLCDKNGFIYKKTYKMKYCIGCELEKTDSELLEGKCPIHPSLSIEEIDEENYFFKFSAFEKPLLDFYASHKDFVAPSFRFNEIQAFVARGLKDFSISRLKSKMSWGVPVPNDPDHVMYVWFDALVSYLSTLGWPHDMKSFETWWVSTGGAVQYCGKDNLRQQSAMWQAMLLAAKLPPSKQIVINGFITGDGGIKMSKSLGNTIDPLEVIKDYGTDAFRFFVLKEIHSFEDSPFTMERFKESYNSQLANGLGNLTSRVMKMAEGAGVTLDAQAAKPFDSSLHQSLYDSYEINKVCDDIWNRIQEADKFVQDNQPFKTIKTDEKKGKEQIAFLVATLYHIATALKPLLPETSLSILASVEKGLMPEKPLFVRK